MSAAKFRPHAFAGNPIRAKTPKSSDPVSPNSALETLRVYLLRITRQPISRNFRVLLFRKGRPLVGSGRGDTNSAPGWHLGWLSLAECQVLLVDSEVRLNGESLVYMGSRLVGEEEDVVYWAIDVSEDSKLVEELARRQCCFVELTLMVATDWADPSALGVLAMRGHCWNGMLPPAFVGIVEAKQSPWKLVGGCSALMNCAKRESTLVLIRLSLC